MFFFKLFDGIEDILCVMDFNCKFVLGVDEIILGVRFIKLYDLCIFYYDVFKCYYEDILLKLIGIVFRFLFCIKIFVEKFEFLNKEVIE